jgi:hypothetical protein
MAVVPINARVRARVWGVQNASRHSLKQKQSEPIHSRTRWFCNPLKHDLSKSIDGSRRSVLTRYATSYALHRDNNKSTHSRTGHRICLLQVSNTKVRHAGKKPDLAWVYKFCSGGKTSRETPHEDPSLAERILTWQHQRTIGGSSGSSHLRSGDLDDPRDGDGRWHGLDGGNDELGSRAAERRRRGPSLRRRKVSADVFY